MEPINVLLFSLLITVSILLGGLLGWQRQRIGKAAGIRTYALVAGGSTLFTLLSLYGFGDVETTRIAAQILTGIGFLGAGTILHKHHTVEGLTTAAGLWAAAAIGMAVGVGWVLLAVIVSVLVLFVMSFDDHRWRWRG